MSDQEFELFAVMAETLIDIRDEIKRFNDREEAKPYLPEGWQLDIPVS